MKNCRVQRQEILNVVDISIFSESIALSRIRKLLVLTSGLTTISESAEISYGMRDINSLFNMIELPYMLQKTLLVIVPLIYFIELLGINRKYTVPSIESLLEIIYLKAIPTKYKKKWPPLSMKNEVLASFLYIPLFLISVTIASINAYFFMQLIPKTDVVKQIDTPS